MLYDCVEQSPDGAIHYDVRLLQFAVSISFRTLLLYLSDLPNAYCEQTRSARKQWSLYLRGKTQSLACYTQHVFLVPQNDSKRHLVIGGQVYWDQSIVVSQIGPLHIVGLLDRKQLTGAERRIWERSKLTSDGEILTPVTEWHVGHNITMNMIRLLCKQEEVIIRKVIAAGDAAFTKVE